MNNHEKQYQVALTLVEGVGGVMLRQLISHCGSAENVFKTSSANLLKIRGIGNHIVNGLKKVEVLQESEKIIERIEKEKASGNLTSLLFFTDKEYPARLKNLYDAPCLLYYKGNADLNHQKTIGIVGTRQATDYGKEVTEEIVKDLLNYNPLIISGLAYGIDIAAHKAAIKNNLPTIAIMATSLEVVYPAEHKKYAQKMLENGGWLSENHFGSKPVRQSFLARNRIIAALSDAVIVVESAQKGGAMVTAEYANNYHKEVFAVPGNLKNSHSEGTNYLIKNNKASILTAAKDIIENLNWDLEENTQKTLQDTILDLSQFTEEESQVMAFLVHHKETQIDDLSWKTQIPINRLASLLLNLEFQGFVKAMPGKKFGIK